MCFHLKPTIGPLHERKNYVSIVLEEEGNDILKQWSYSRTTREIYCGDVFYDTSSSYVFALIQNVAGPNIYPSFLRLHKYSSDTQRGRLYKSGSPKFSFL